MTCYFESMQNTSPTRVSNCQCTWGSLSLWTVMDWGPHSEGLKTYLTFIYWFKIPVLLK